MNLRSSNPYWLYHTPLLDAYYALQKNLKTDVVVIGAGISGALVAYALTKAGCKVVIISKHHVGTESTCACTSILQYEIDTSLVELVHKTGKQNAVRSYLMCHAAIDDLEKIHHSLGIQKIFSRRKSLQLASVKKDVIPQQIEARARQDTGISVQWLNQEELKNEFGFHHSSALYSSQGAVTDAYLLTQKLIRWCAEHGALVYDKTEVKNVQSNRRSVQVLTSAGKKINARHVVMATGYESVKWIDNSLTQLHTTYAIVSEPFQKKELWKDECVIWETARPYLYVRTTPDHRVIIGGKDEMFFNPAKRDALLIRKSKQLQSAFHKLFPHLKFTVDFSWAGTFAETKDGLPFIGTHEKMPNVFYALGFGGNGVPFSQVAAVIIRDKILGRKNEDEKIFSFERLNSAGN